MLNFKEYLEEKLITFGGKAYPKFGQIVILAGGAGCFDGETLINCEDEYKKISEIEEGDLVWTFDEESGERSLQPVEELVEFENHPEEILELTFENGESVVCTENHKFYVDGAWVAAKDL